MSAKKKLPPFKKHILIPLALCGFIVLVGTYMSLSNQAGIGRAKEFRVGQDRANANTVEFTVSGGNIIASGLIMAIVVLYIWGKEKK